METICIMNINDDGECTGFPVRSCYGCGTSPAPFDYVITCIKKDLIKLTLCLFFGGIYGDDFDAFSL